jgi:AcrR family transcriptional regulator
MVAIPSSRSGKSASAERKWRRRAEARPDEILEAALSEFTERGFDAARMEDVARRAGLSKAGVYLYFESKEALLKALIARKIAPMAQQARAAVTAGAADPAGALRMLVTLAATRLADPNNFAVPRLVISVSARFPEIAEYHRTQVVELLRDTIEALITAGIAKGVFREVDPRAAARAVIGPLLFEAMWTHVLRGESALAAPETLIEAQLDLLLKGLAKEARA